MTPCSRDDLFEKMPCVDNTHRAAIHLGVCAILRCEKPEGIAFTSVGSGIVTEMLAPN